MRHLIKNPWFQLCAITAAVSGSISVYNWFGPKSGDRPAEGSQTTQTSQNGPQSHEPSLSVGDPNRRKLTPKKPGTWIVDASGSRDSDSKDIGKVLDSANDGDTILIKGGTYNEAIDIRKNVTIRGENISGTRPLVSTRAKKYAVTIDAKDVKIEGLDVFQSGGGEFYGLGVSGETFLEMKDCSFRSVGEWAASIWGKCRVKASKCSFSTQGDGSALGFRNAVYGEFEDCLIEENKSYGIYADQDAKLMLTRCALRKNGEAAIWFSSSGSLELRECTFDEGKGGITAQTSTISIYDSSFTHLEMGIICNKVKGLIQNCTFSGVSAFCIQSVGSSVIQISHSKFLKNPSRDACVFVAGQSEVTMEKTIVEENGTASFSGVLEVVGGILIAKDRGAKLTLKDCRVVKNTRGFFVVAGAVLELTNCTVDSNGLEVSKEMGLQEKMGVLTAFGNPTKVTVRKSTITNNKQGLHIGLGAEAVFEECDISRNGKSRDGVVADAISVYSAGSALEIKKSTISESPSTAIDASAGAVVSLTEANISNSGGTGVTIRGMNTRLTATKTTFRGNRYQGLVVLDNGFAEITDCDFIGNTENGIAVSYKDAKGGRLQLTKSRLTGNGNYGLAVVRGGEAELTDTVFSGNKGGPFVQEPDAVVIQKGKNSDDKGGEVVSSSNPKLGEVT